jgi:chromosome segregation ATPase
MEYDVLIVGGGPAGLCAAIKLKQLAENEKAGLSSTIFNRNVQNESILYDEIKSKNTQIAELEAKINELLTESVHVKNNASIKDNELLTLKRIEASLNLKLSDINKDLESTKRDKAILENDIKLLNGKYEILTKEKADVISKINNSNPQDNIEMLKNQYLEEKETSSKIKLQHDQLASEINVIKIKQSELINDKATLEIQLEVLKKTLYNKDFDIQKLNEEFLVQKQELLKTIDDLKSKNTKYELNNSSLIASLDNSKEIEINTLKEKYDQNMNNYEEILKTEKVYIICIFFDPFLLY